MAFSAIADQTPWLGRVSVDLKTLPRTVDLSGSRAAAVILLVFSGIWTMIAMSIFASFGDAPVFVSLFAATFPFVGLALLAVSIHLLLRRRVVTFARSGVSVKERKLLTESEWQAPYSEFEGVLLREYTRRGKHSSTTYQIIELKHPDPSKTLPLHIQSGTEPPRTAWEGYVDKLGLPALRQTADDIVERDASDLDHTLKMLADEGKIEVDYDPSEPVPGGLLVEAVKARGGDELRVTMLANRIPLWVRAPFYGFPALFVLVGFIRPEAWPMSVVGAVFVCGAHLIFQRSARSPRTIVLTRDALTVADSSILLEAQDKTFRLNDIEDLMIKNSRTGFGLELRISSDRHEAAAGHGLSRDALDWLKRYITAAIVSA